MVIPIIKAKPGHLAAIMVMCCSVTVGHCAAASLSHSVLEKTALRLWDKTPWLADKKDLW